MWGQQQGGYGGGMGGGYQGGMGGGYQGGMGGGYQGGMGGGPNPNMQYRIVSTIKPEFCLDSSGSALDKHQTILYSYHGGANQRWRFQPVGPNEYLIINGENNGALEAE